VPRDAHEPHLAQSVRGAKMNELMPAWSYGGQIGFTWAELILFLATVFVVVFTLVAWHQRQRDDK
jgi:hypothetical protein